MVLKYDRNQSRIHRPPRRWSPSDVFHQALEIMERLNAAYDSEGLLHTADILGSGSRIWQLDGLK